METREVTERNSRGQSFLDTVSGKEVKIIGDVDCTGECFAITVFDEKRIRVNTRNLEPTPLASNFAEENFRRRMDIKLVRIYDQGMC